jgi:hypothetical protein
VSVREKAAGKAIFQQGLVYNVRPLFPKLSSPFASSFYKKLATNLYLVMMTLWKSQQGNP